MQRGHIYGISASSTKTKKVIISNDCFDTSINVIKSRFKFLDIDFEIADIQSISIDKSVCALIGQFPSKTGQLNDYSTLFKNAKEYQCITILATDPLALTLYKSPKEMNADIAIGSSQRFGVPLGFGGPSAAYIACKDTFKRQLPGRIIGISKDRHNQTAYRMALQTREQHIRRENATSNICTAQALLAIINSFYAIYHGPKGLHEIATTIKQKTDQLSKTLTQHGIQIKHTQTFDTICIETNQVKNITNNALQQNIEWLLVKENTIQISINECTTEQDISDIANLFGTHLVIDKTYKLTIPKALKRQTTFLTQDVFNNYYSETKLLRYMKSLEKKDLSLADAMIPLGSCTMKLNATTELLALSYPEFSNIHPFSNAQYTQGYSTIINTLERQLSEITGFAKQAFNQTLGHKVNLRG